MSTNKKHSSDIDMKRDEKNYDGKGLEEGIVKPMLRWYDHQARILPWREDPQPYKVWVSEIMLQQTRVEAVKPFYDRFLKALPTIEDLAFCKEDKLMKLWEGLGYYNRVRNMQKAALQVMEQFGGQLPSDYEELLTLSGIGSYTAGAISSIAYQKKAPAVDGNVLRVITRLTLNEGDILKQSVKKEVEKQVMEIIPEDRPGDFNQSLIELGAIICVPNGVPKCQECPVAFCCQAFKTGRIDEFPKKKQKQKRKIEEKTVLVIQETDRVGIHKRDRKGLLPGLYELPNLSGHLTQEEVIDYLEVSGFRPLRIQPLETAKHIFSHVEWRMIGYVIRIEDLTNKEEKDNSLDLIFEDPKKAEEHYSIPAAFSAYTAYMNIRLGQDKYKES